MRLPIMYTMSWPERVATSNATWPRLDFSKADRCGGTSPFLECVVIFMGRGERRWMAHTAVNAHVLLHA